MSKRWNEWILILVINIALWCCSKQTDICNSNISRDIAHLSILERVNLGVEGRADDLLISCVRWRACAGHHVVAGQALGVRDGVVLPWGEGDAVQRALQDPVTWPRGVGRLQDHVGNLKHLSRQGSMRGQGSIKNQKALLLTACHLCKHLVWATAIDMHKKLCKTTYSKITKTLQFIHRWD